MNAARLRLIGAVVVVAAVLIGAWMWLTAGRESTDDAQIEGYVTQIAARVGGSVLRVPVTDNQPVNAGDVLVEIDPRDNQVALEKAKAELADAEAAAVAARSNVPIASTTASSNVTMSQGSVVQARGAAEGAQQEVDAARARLASAHARLREAEASATKAVRDVDRLRGLLAKDEVSQQQFDAAVAAADAAKASTDSARSQVVEAEAGIRVAEGRLTQARGGEQQAHAAMQAAATGPQQVTATRAKAASAEAHVQQLRAAVTQAELSLEYATVKAPVRGQVAKKSVNPGQVVQSGQPLMALVQLDDVWVTANFKETQLTGMRPGQRATITVDAYGGKKYRGHVASIAAATGARFSMLPPENATGNYVKVVQRVPVKIVFEAGQDPEHLLRPGMSVVPAVYTR
jgi:membrane fusion protein (multidrug efflux system)